MNHRWRLLDVPTTSSTREIKKAYAARLKQVRADENPREFQALHEEYERALRFAGSNSNQSTDEEIEISLGNWLSETDPANLPQPAQIPDAAAGEKLRLKEKVNEVMADQMRFYQRESWFFLVQTPLLFDDWHSKELSLEIFRRLCSLYDRYRVPDPDWTRFSSAFEYLDSIFFWRESEEILTHEIGEKAAKLILRMGYRRTASPESKAMDALRGGAAVRFIAGEAVWIGSHSEIKDRFMAFILDLINIPLTLFIMSLLLKEFSYDFFYKWLSLNEAWVIKSFPLVGFLYFWLFESSELKATPGKLVLGIKVMTLRYHRMPVLQGLKRTAAFFFYIAGFVVLLPINLFFLKKGLLHDLVSKTIVVKTQ